MEDKLFRYGWQQYRLELLAEGYIDGSKDWENMKLEFELDCAFDPTDLGPLSAVCEEEHKADVEEVDTQMRTDEHGKKRQGEDEHEAVAKEKLRKLESHQAIGQAACALASGDVPTKSSSSSGHEPSPEHISWSCSTFLRKAKFQIPTEAELEAMIE